MTADELKADLDAIITLLDDINKVFPTEIENQVVNFLKMAESEPLILNIIVLILSRIGPAVLAEKK